MRTVRMLFFNMSSWPDWAAALLGCCAPPAPRPAQERSLAMLQTAEIMQSMAPGVAQAHPGSARRALRKGERALCPHCCKGGGGSWGRARRPAAPPPLSCRCACTAPGAGRRSRPATAARGARAQTRRRQSLQGGKGVWARVGVGELGGRDAYQTNGGKRLERKKNQSKRK